MAITYMRVAPQLQVAAGTSGAGATPDLPNSGISLITNTTTEIFTLMPPEFGVRKTVIFSVSSATNLTHTVRGSSAQTVTFSGGTLGGNTALPTMFKLAATRSTNQNTVVELVGLSSVTWQVTSVYPVMATGNGSGSVTFSTT